MRHYILASHKLLAEGFQSAVKTIVGDVANVHIISAYVESNDVATDIENCMKQIPNDDEIIVLTDIVGGSVNNEFMKYLNKREFHLISGINLALVLSIMVEIPETVSREILIEKIEDCKSAIRYCNDDVVINKEEEDF